MNIKRRTEAKNDFKRHFFKLMKNVLFGKTEENVRKQRDTRLAATDKRRSYLVSEPNHHSIK